MKPLLLVTVVSAATLLGGCSLLTAGEPHNSRYPVEIIETQPAKVAMVRVTQVGESLRVTGTVRKPYEFRLPGTVDITLCGANAELLAYARPGITGYASKRGGMQEARFAADLPALPDEAFLRVRYNPPGGAQEALGCR
ncbi:MAG: hypothetical protein FDZ69_08310 [Deltaproteobacteria bacterium]|nr:MAG: hypothetical protein FDZ69_08310 [Deltaproteobacteria bacterium]